MKEYHWMRSYQHGGALLVGAEVYDAMRASAEWLTPKELSGRVPCRVNNITRRFPSRFPDATARFVRQAKPRYLFHEEIAELYRPAASGGVARRADTVNGFAATIGTNPQRVRGLMARLGIETKTVEGRRLLSESERRLLAECFSQEERARASVREAVEPGKEYSRRDLCAMGLEPSVLVRRGYSSGGGWRISGEGLLCFLDSAGPGPTFLTARRLPEARRAAAILRGAAHRSYRENEMMVRDAQLLKSLGLFEDYRRIRDGIVAANEGLVYHVNRGLGVGDDHDIHAESFIDLMKAIDGFREGKGVKFSTYAGTAIAYGSLRRLKRRGGEKREVNGVLDHHTHEALPSEGSGLRRSSEIGAVLHEALRELPAEERAALERAFRFEGGVGRRLGQGNRLVQQGLRRLRSSEKAREAFILSEFERLQSAG